MTAGFLTVAAFFATFAYLYLVALFFSARWAKHTFLPVQPSQINKYEAEQRRHLARRAAVKTNGAKSPVKKEDEEDTAYSSSSHDEFAPPAAAINQPAATFAEVVKGAGEPDPEEAQREKMKRDIERSLQ